MAETFLQLTPQERSEIYRALAPRLGRAPVVLEKDVWVCWVLQALFTRQGRLPMAFKGGTSLSKVYRAIDRFSEYVDITLDYRGLDSTVDPFAVGLSKTKLKLFSEGLKSFVRDHVHHVLVPLWRGSFWPTAARAVPASRRATTVNASACITRVPWATPWGATSATTC
jgi:hypothetical protein